MMLLLVCFPCISSLAIITHSPRKDRYQPCIIALCALIATVMGAIQTANVQNFISRYLFWECALGAGGSAIFHYTSRREYTDKQSKVYYDYTMGIALGNEPGFSRIVYLTETV